MAKESGYRKNQGTAQTDLFLPTDRQLPYSIEAEAGVIGAILLNPTLCDEIALILRPEDFYSGANRTLFRHMIDMNAEGSKIDITLLTERLRRAGVMAEIGGESYLAELMTSVQVTAHATYYAQIVRDKAVLRELIESSSQILSNVYESGKTPRELIALAEEKIFAIGDSRSSGNAATMKDVMTDVFNKIDNMTSGEMDGVATGFHKLDEILNGLHASELIILAARPSMGKTAFATNIADFVAVEEKQPVLFFSLEMNKVELAIRMLCSRGRIPGSHFKGNFLTDDERERFLKVTSELTESPLYIDDSPSRTVSEIAAVARRIKRLGSLGLIVIDYLGLIEPDNASDPRQEQVAKIARRLKALARELDVPVLCLAQLNRQAEQTKDNRPRLSHLRESGAIEQDADVVMFVHREEYYMREDEAEDKDKRGKAEIIIAKQRNGAVGSIELRWIAENTRFMNLDDGYPEEGGYNSDFSAYSSSEF